ncbi:hypothetical protein [Ruminococcus flavefaciens]|uniref:hypothetical protein n=1 Tax=Ruminococcus flavefaciens TaxID=1265 RepID=UPI00048C80BB|nr:hypothetical protein [Ruminococcus flavefaciens]
MKKAKILGLLMAFTLTAVPATGIAENVLPVSNNAIVADAAGAPYSIRVNSKNGNQVFKEYDTPILRSFNKNYTIWLDESGKLVFCKKSDAQRVIFDFSNLKKERRYDSQGHLITNFALYMQVDGNLVVYNVNNGKIVDPVAISNTWMYYITNPKVDFTYELTDDGVFIIKRNILSGQFKGKSEIIWRVRYTDLPKNR